MKISHDLYVGESLTRKKDKIIKKITKGRKVLSLFCIANPSNEDNLLDIYYYNELFQKVFRNYYDITIYGIAGSREEAQALVERIVMDCLEKQGDCDVKGYLGMKKESVQY